MLVCFPGSAQAAEFGITPGGFSARVLDAEGNPDNRAGAHPNRILIDFSLIVEDTGTTMRDLTIDMPPGLGGNLNAVPECPRIPYEEGVECPPETQVGVAKLGTSKNGLPVYQLEPEPGQIGAFATKPGFELPLSMSLDPDDFGTAFEASNPQQFAVSQGQMELWGVPADHQEETAIPRRPFLTLPSRCGPLVFGLRTRSWQPEAPWLTATAEAEEPLEGCEQLTFAPSLGVNLSNPVADSPTGMRIDISAPEDEDASGLANAQIKDVTVEMPAGVTVSPSGAERLMPCSDAQFGLGSTAEPACPPSSRVGSVEMSSSSLREPLAGSIYLGEGHPGERLRLLVVAPGPGIFLKFTSSLRPDSTTGRLSTTLHDLPQASLQRLSLNMDGGSRALLSSPLSCGPTLSTATFVPYGDGQAVRSSASLFVNGRAPDGRCTGAPPFAPELLAGSVSPRAGRYSPFWAILRRKDGEQLPRRFAMALPPGLSASLGALTTCSEVQLASSCPETSRMGSVLLKVGSGAEPVPIRGGIYLTGPYRGAPFGMLMELRAGIGAIDLGVMRIRAAMQIDRRTGRFGVSSDPLPALVEGVPIRFQEIELNLNRPRFIRNPTSCRPASLDASLESQSGTAAAASSPFTVTGCKRLGFAPRIQMAFEGSNRSAGGAKVGLRVTTRLRPGDTNLKTLRMSFPKALRLSLSAVKEICSRQDASDGRCPARSRVGASTARTPMLKEPLRGSIYVVKPRGNGLPDLSVALAARGVQAQLSGTSSIHDGSFVTTLSELPDMPLSSVTMQIGSAEKGAFSLDGGLCAHGRTRRFTSDVLVGGQDGAKRRLQPSIGTQARCRVDSRASR